MRERNQVRVRNHVMSERKRTRERGKPTSSQRGNERERQVNEAARETTSERDNE